MKWITHGGNFMTTSTVKVDFSLPEFSATEVVTW